MLSLSPLGTVLLPSNNDATTYPLTIINDISIKLSESDNTLFYIMLAVLIAVIPCLFLFKWFSEYEYDKLENMTKEEKSKHHTIHK